MSYPGISIGMWIPVKRADGMAPPPPPVPGEPCLIHCGPGSLLRFAVGTWETGHGWKTQQGIKLHDVKYYIPIRNTRG